MKKQTAIEWLEHKINDELEIYNNQWLLIENFIEQAKEIEKQQIEHIYNQIKELYDNENITGFSKLAYAKCLDIIKNK